MISSAFWQNIPQSTPLTHELITRYLTDHLFTPSVDEEKIGVEFEFFLVKQSAHELRGVLKEPLSSLNAILLNHARQCSWKIFAEPQDNGEDLITGYEIPNRGLITFEPGKQLELSTRCFTNFAEFTQDVESILAELKAPLAEDHLALLPIGIYPFAEQDRVGDAESRLTHPKQRYRSMATYYASKGIWGEVLMKQTAAIQVCCDNGQTSEELAERYILGELLAPYVMATFAYSPLIHQKWGTMLSARAAIVKNHDPLAAGVHHHLMDHLITTGEPLNATDCVAIYRKFLLASRVLVTPNHLDRPLLDGVTFQEWLDHGIDNTQACVGDLSHQLSYIFPENRPKGFLELRSPDCQGTPWMFTPITYYMGLMLHPSSRQAALKLLKPFAKDASQHWDYAQNGLRHPKIAELSQKLMKLALDGAHRIPGKLGSSLASTNQITKLATFARHFTFNHRVPSQDLLDILDQHQRPQHATDTLPQELFTKLHQYWDELST